MGAACKCGYESDEDISLIDRDTMKRERAEVPSEGPIQNDNDQDEEFDKEDSKLATEDTDGIEEHGIQVVSEPGDSSQKGELATSITPQGEIDTNGGGSLVEGSVHKSLETIGKAEAEAGEKSEIPQEIDKNEEVIEGGLEEESVENAGAQTDSEKPGEPDITREVIAADLVREDEIQVAVNDQNKEMTTDAEKEATMGTSGEPNISREMLNDPVQGDEILVEDVSHQEIVSSVPLVGESDVTQEEEEEDLEQLQDVTAEQVAKVSKDSVKVEETSRDIVDNAKEAKNVMDKRDPAEKVATFSEERDPASSPKEDSAETSEDKQTITHREFTVSIKERPIGVRFGHEEEGKKLVVLSVTPGKLAERVGIRPGDIVLSINQELIQNSSEALKKFRTCTLPMELCLLTTQAKIDSLSTPQKDVEEYSDWIADEFDEPESANSISETADEGEIGEVVSLKILEASHEDVQTPQQNLDEDLESKEGKELQKKSVSIAKEAVKIKEQSQNLIGEEFQTHKRSISKSFHDEFDEP